MVEELDMSEMQYNVALTVFFIPYILFEILSNMVLKVVRPSWWISFMIVSWGTVRIEISSAHHWQLLTGAH